MLKGTSTGRDSGGRLVPTPPALERAAPEPPDDAWFTAEARAEWQRIRELLRTHALTVRPRRRPPPGCRLPGRRDPRGLVLAAAWDHLFAIDGTTGLPLVGPPRRGFHASGRAAAVFAA